MIKILKATFTDSGILLECWDVDMDAYGSILLNADATELISFDRDKIWQTNASFVLRAVRRALEENKPIAPQTIHWY